MLHRLATKQDRVAMKKYHAAYSNTHYVRATTGKSVQYANALTDEALALCGSPYYRLSNRRWSVEAQSFLERFVS
jgi:hypothetical protein